MVSLSISMVAFKLILRVEDVYHIPIASRAHSSTALLSRYQSFSPLSADLPLLEHISYPGPPIHDILHRTPTTLFDSTGSDSPVTAPASPTDEVAFTFALFGWTGVSEARISLAVCDHCFQRLGLWLFSDTRLKDMSKKLDVPVESLRLNLLESHREHCPWKNAETQANSSDGPIANMAAWQTLQFMFLGKPKELAQNKFYERGHSRNVESVDLGSEADYPRGSMESYHEDKEKEEGADSMQEKWKRFKAKLRRTTSKKSLKSMKSIRSTKSAKSTTTIGQEKAMDRS